MKIFFLHILLLFSFSASVAQSNCTAKKAYAYYNAAMPGMQRADERGNPIDPKPIITRFIYLEYSGSKAPEIKSVLYNYVALDYRVILIKEKTVFAGDKEFNPKNSITAKKGNSFLRIDLQPFDGKEMPAAGIKNIIIKSKVAGKQCILNVPGEKEFITPPRY